MEKPILFNAEMVRAILQGRKTVTRRVVRQKYDNTVLEIKTDKYGTRLIEIEQDVEGVTFGKYENGHTWRKIRGYIEPKPPYRKGDILYVRETWKSATTGYAGCVTDTYLYRADGEETPEGYLAEPGWHPSIHMPKRAARIWLRVTDVHAEHLQDMTNEDAIKEGIKEVPCDVGPVYTDYMLCPQRQPPVVEFAELWDSTISPKDIGRYGFDADPWVWVVEFEKLDSRF